MDEIKFDISLTEEDIYLFQKRHLYKKTSPVTINTIGSIFAAIIVVLMVYQSIYGTLLPFSLLLLLLIFPAMLLVGYPYVINKATKNIVRTSKLYGRTHTCEVNNEGFKVTSENSNAFIKWADFYKAVETPESFLLYISKVQAHIIPKRCVADEAGLAFVRRCISNVPIPKERGGSILKGFLIGLLIYLVLFLVLVLILTIYGG